MRITAVDLYEVRVPTRPDAVNSTELGPAGWDTVPKFLLRVHTDEGITGCGETYRGIARDTVAEAARSVLGKDPMTFSLANLPIGNLGDWGREKTAKPTRYHELRNQRHPAYDAFEIAIFDIVGKALNQPLYVLLGGAYRDRVSVDYWTGRRTVKDLVGKAELAQRLGFHGIKIKCTVEDPVVEGVRTIEKACGPDFKVTIDPNQRFYRPAEALQVIQALNDCESVQVFEDPVPKDNQEWYRLLRRKSHHPIAQHLSSPQDVLRALTEEAVDYLNLNHSMTGFIKLAAMADSVGIRVWHGSGCDLGILDMSYIHASAVPRNCTLPGDPVGHFIREDDLIVEGIQIENGHAVLPQTPGLGVTLDMAAVEKYAIAQALTLTAES